jgi:subtilisin family serine protease/photosystem II stability/assembly factor-like uncharacterized protein
MKKQIITRLLFCFYAIIIINSINAQSIIKPTKQIAYTIDVPGQLLSNGYYSPAKNISIEQLAQDEYMPNQVQIKLTEGAKDKFLPGNKVQNDPLLEYFNNINASSIVNLNSDLKISSQEDIFGVGRIYEITYSADKDPYEVCKELIKNPDVEYAVPVFKRYIYSFTPNDPQFSSQWALAKIKATDAWDITKGDTSIVIAIVDNGTDWQHVDLKANIWNNTGEIPNNGIDDDSNGKIDDIHGWDFVGNATGTDISQGNWREDNDPKNPSQYHGTHTAGIAGAVVNNMTGVAGIGFNCRIMPLKCATDVSGYNGIYRGYAAILYAAQMGAEIISCSWGGPGFSPAEQDIINQVTAMGSLVVAAAGNDGKNVDIMQFYPGNYTNVLNVGSTASDDKAASSSNYGSRVTVYAPGENILSTYPNNAYNTISGTSMACPLAAGLAGLVKSIHPDWKPEQIIQQLRVTCDNVIVPTNQAYRYLYWGRINALKAVQSNNADYPGNNVPGLKIFSMALTGTDALRNYDPVNIRLSLKNYLTKADSVNVSIQPISKFVSVSQKDFRIYNLGTNDTANIDLGVQLLINNPWFKGKAEIQITFTTTGYTDIQKIDIPIDLPSNNVFSAKGSVNSSIYPQWNGVSSPDIETSWGVGNSLSLGALYFRSTNFAYNANRVMSGGSYVTDPLYCVCSFDETTAIAGTGKGYLLRTVNGGNNWSNISVSTITGFVNAIMFKDQDTGILLGDPKGGRWGIGITSDKGQSWNLASNPPVPMLNESGYVESVYQDYTDIWFGTSVGRIFYSHDFGKSWRANTVQSGGTIIRMAYYDSLHGIAAYNETGGTNQTLYLANTSDGGKTWNKRVMNLTQNGLYPLNLYALPHTRRILAVFSNGVVMTTADLGQTWVPVLSEQTLSYEAIKTIVQNKSVRIWEAGDNINSLDFNYEFDSGLTSIRSEDIPNISMKVYPVPSSDILHVNLNLNKGEETDIQLLDITGRLIKQVYRGKSGAGYSDYVVNVSDMTSGFYFIKIQSSDTIKTNRIIISR